MALPNALAEWNRFRATIRPPIAVFLDYDGTLTPIVDHPEDARLDVATRLVVDQLKRVWPTYIVTGRSLEAIRQLAQLDGIWIAACHGYEIAAPDGRVWQAAPEFRPEIARVADDLKKAMAGFPGVIVEDKRFAVVAHYRLAPEVIVPEVIRIVDEEHLRHPRLAKLNGKCVVELRPGIDWNKGRAVIKLLGQHPGAMPIYLGDDQTDEDALGAIAGGGVGIVVMEEQRATKASWSLRKTGEVRELIERLTTLA